VSITYFSNMLINPSQGTHLLLLHSNIRVPILLSIISSILMDLKRMSKFNTFKAGIINIFGIFMVGSLSTLQTFCHDILLFIIIPVLLIFSE